MATSIASTQLRLRAKLTQRRAADSYCGRVQQPARSSRRSLRVRNRAPAGISCGTAAGSASASSSRGDLACVRSVAATTDAFAPGVEGEALAGGRIYLLQVPAAAADQVDLQVRVWTPPGYENMPDGQSARLVLLNSGEELEDVLKIFSGMMACGLVVPTAFAVVDPVASEFYCPYLPAATPEAISAAAKYVPC